MRVVTILGSPKINGNTAKVLGHYIVPFCTTPDAIGSEAAAIVKKMARDIVGVR